MQRIVDEIAQNEATEAALGGVLNDLNDELASLRNALDFVLGLRRARVEERRAAAVLNPGRRAPTRKHGGAPAGNKTGGENDDDDDDDDDRDLDEGDCGGGGSHWPLDGPSEDVEEVARGFAARGDRWSVAPALSCELLPRYLAPPSGDASLRHAGVRVRLIPRAGIGWNRGTSLIVSFRSLEVQDICPDDSERASEELAAALGMPPEPTALRFVAQKAIPCSESQDPWESDFVVPSYFLRFPVIVEAGVGLSHVADDQLGEIVQDPLLCYVPLARRRLDALDYARPCPACGAMAYSAGRRELVPRMIPPGFDFLSSRAELEKLGREITASSLRKATGLAPGARAAVETVTNRVTVPEWAALSSEDGGEAGIFRAGCLALLLAPLDRPPDPPDPGASDLHKNVLSSDQVAFRSYRGPEEIVITVREPPDSSPPGSFHINLTTRSTDAALAYEVSESLCRRLGMLFDDDDADADGKEAAGLRGRPVVPASAYWRKLRAAEGMVRRIVVEREGGGGERGAAGPAFAAAVDDIVASVLGPDAAGRRQGAPTALKPVCSLREMLLRSELADETGTEALAS